MADSVIDEAVVACADGGLALVERVEGDAGGVVDRVVLSVAVELAVEA